MLLTVADNQIQQLSKELDLRSCSHAYFAFLDPKIWQKHKTSSSWDLKFTIQGVSTRHTRFRLTKLVGLTFPIKLKRNIDYQFTAPIPKDRNHS